MCEFYNTNYPLNLQMSDEEDEFIKANTPTRKPSQPSALSLVIPTKKGRTLESYFNAHNPADSEHTESEKVRKSQAPPNLLSTSSKPWTAALRVPTKGNKLTLSGRNCLLNPIC